MSERMLRRFGALLVVPMVLAAVPGVAPHSVATQTPAKICTVAARKFAQLPPPTSLEDLIDGVREFLFDVDGVTIDLEDAAPKLFFDDHTAYTRHLRGFSDAVEDLRDALGAPIGAPPRAPLGPAAHSAIAKAQYDLAGIDETRAKAKVPAACSSEAFGAGYLAQAASLITTVVPGPTGEFTTDGNAACARLNRKLRGALDQQSDDVPDYVLLLDRAFTSFQLDVQALTPPADLTTQFASLQDVLDRAVQKLAALTISVDDASQSRLKKVSRELSALGEQLAAATTALGLDC
jgi:hypothetical protein